MRDEDDVERSGEHVGKEIEWARSDEGEYPEEYHVGGTSRGNRSIARARRMGTRVGDGTRMVEGKGGALRWYEVTSRRVDTHSYYNLLVYGDTVTSR